MAGKCTTAARSKAMRRWTKNSDDARKLRAWAPAALASSIAGTIFSGVATSKANNSTPCAKRRNAAHARHRLDEYVLSLAVELGRQQADSGDVAARARERCRKAFRDHVLGHADERDGPGERL